MDRKERRQNTTVIIGHLLKEAFDAKYPDKSKSVNAFADECEIPQQTMDLILKGIRQPDHDDLMTILESLGQDSHEFFDKIKYLKSIGWHI